MPFARSGSWAAAAFAIACAQFPPVPARAQSPSHWPDQSFRAGFEDAAAGPASDAEASRFLAQATFGANLDDIAHLRSIGYGAWLDEQFAQPPSTQVAYLDWVERLVCPIDDEYCNVVAEWAGTRLQTWTINVVGTPDPLIVGPPAEIYEFEENTGRVFPAL